MTKKEIALVTFDYHGHKQNDLAGVQRVIATQQQMLQRNNRKVSIVTGSTDHPTPHTAGIHLFAPLRSGEYMRWDHGEVTHDQRATEHIVANLERMTEGKQVIHHNSTNAARHNPPYGVAAAHLVTRRTRDHAPSAAIWVHDTRRVTPEQLWHFLPHERNAKIAVVSDVRKRQLEEQIARMKLLGLDTQDFHIRVIPNAIDEMFFAAVSAPQGINDLAPDSTHFSSTWGLQQHADIAEKVIFSAGEYTLFLVPARIAHQKKIEYSLRAVEAYAKKYHEKAAVIVTGRPDDSRPENVTYWHALLRQLRESTSDHPVIFLGGTQWKYMPWLYAKSDLLLAPFENEGFSLPPLEAACMGLSSVISDDPAMIETTEGHALQIPRALWKEDPDAVATHIHHYLHSRLSRKHAADLRDRADTVYSFHHTGSQIEDFLES